MFLKILSPEFNKKYFPARMTKFFAFIDRKKHFRIKMRLVVLKTKLD